MVTQIRNRPIVRASSPPSAHRRAFIDTSILGHDVAYHYDETREKWLSDEVWVWAMGSNANAKTGSSTLDEAGKSLGANANYAWRTMPYLMTLVGYHFASGVSGFSGSIGIKDGTTIMHSFSLVSVSGSDGQSSDMTIDVDLDGVSDSPKYYGFIDRTAGDYTRPKLRYFLRRRVE